MYMNRGSNKPQPNSIDEFIYRLNKRLGRVLGKANNPRQPQQSSSNKAFIVVTLLSGVVIWLCTGFYFLTENEYGLELINGHVTEVKRGLQIGFTFPYPFGDIKVIDVVPDQLIQIGMNPANLFTILDKDMLPVNVEAKFSYQITDPKTLYRNHIQNQDEFDDEISWVVQSYIRRIIASKSFDELKDTNFTVLARGVIADLTPELAKYGVALTKLDIISINSASDVSESQTVVVPLQQVNSEEAKTTANSSDIRETGREVNRDRVWMGE